MSKLDDILEDNIDDRGNTNYIALEQQIKDLVKIELEKYIRESKNEFDSGWNNAIYAMQDVIEEEL